MLAGAGVEAPVEPLEFVRGTAPGTGLHDAFQDVRVDRPAAAKLPEAFERKRFGGGRTVLNRVEQQLVAQDGGGLPFGRPGGVPDAAEDRLEPGPGQGGDVRPRPGGGYQIGVGQVARDARKRQIGILGGVVAQIVEIGGKRHVAGHGERVEVVLQAPAVLRRQRLFPDHLPQALQVLRVGVSHPVKPGLAVVELEGHGVLTDVDPLLDGIHQHRHPPGSPAGPKMSRLTGTSQLWPESFGR